MVTGRTVSIGNILWKVLKQPIVQDLKYEDAAEYAIEYLRLIGAALSFEDRIERIKLSNYKGLLPANLINIRGIQYSDSECEGGIAMRYASDIYHTNIQNDNNSLNNCQEYTYITQNNVVTTSMKDGWINISYSGLATDEFGYPLIPDNESFKVTENIEIDEDFEYGIGIDVALNVEEITQETIENFINDFNAGKLKLDNTLISFKNEDDQE